MATVVRIDGTVVENVKLTDVQEVGEEGSKRATAHINGETCRVYNSIVDGFNSIWYEQLDFRRQGKP